MPFEISKGTINKALRVVLYGTEGIGKSTFASRFPGAVFIDTEGSTNQLNVARFPAPTTWEMLLAEVEQISAKPSEVGTLVIDTIDWAQQLCITSVCAKAQVDGIEDFGYGKGYSYLFEEFGKLLNRLNDLVDKGVNVVLVAHSTIRTFTKPDEMGQYDRYELKLISTQKCSITGLVKEWADLLLFANYETFIAEDSQTKKKYATGNKRVMYTTHTAAWDAKNRFGMPDKLPFEYEAISKIFENAPTVKASTPTTPVEPTPSTASSITSVYTPEPYTDQEKATIDKIPKQLADLMKADSVKPQELMTIVGRQGHFPSDMPIDQYPAEYYSGFLIPNWPSIIEDIKFDRTLPF